MHSTSSYHSSDAILLQGIAASSQHSFNTLYERHWEKTYASAYKRLKDTDLAKDIVQEIFTHLWVKRETLRIDNLSAYLHVAVRNRVFKQAARGKLTHPFLSVLEKLPSLYEQTDSDLLAKEFFKAYEVLVNSLPAKKQHIFRLRFEEELSTKDIAEQLGLSRKTVQNQLTKAVDFLRAALFIQLILILISFSE
jgi:RNA polymerase sigma-70 factor (family 1)